MTSITTRKGDDWAVVSLSSPAGLNKLGSDTLVPLLDELRSALTGGCRCLGIVGKGGSFAVGADLREIAGLTPSSAMEFSDLGNSIFRLLENHPAPIVAGINGFCLGGGLDLALAADWRTATSRSVFGHPGADLGLITGFGGTQRLPRLVGAKKAARWLYTADRFSGEQAYAAGLVQEVCPEKDFEETFMERVKFFSALSPEWIREVKLGFRKYSDRQYGYGRACDTVR